jgi:protoporphyrinogen oxidase
MSKKVKFLIIGAGPAGLGAAYRLKDLGEEDYLIIEKKDHEGGLATSFLDPQGFTWDIGGHVQFSHYPYFDQAMEEALGKEGWLHHQRESWVWMRNRFIPYPFQNNIHRLPDVERNQCLAGLENPPSNQKENFKDWILGSFGEGISKLFMIPYNFKVWAYPPEDLSYSWIGERVSVVDVDRIKENIRLDRDDVSWGPNNTFQFPVRGGTGSIWQSIAKTVGLEKIQFNHEATEIEPNKKEVINSNGEKIEYQHLLSTMPLDCLAKRVHSLSEESKESAQELVHSSTHIIGIGLKGQPSEDLKTKCWMYFPEDDCPFYRVTVFSNYSPNNVPDINQQYSLMAEVSESSKKPNNHESIVEDVIAGLKNTNLIKDEDQIISKWHYYAPYGYPTPSLGRDKVLNKVIPELDKLGVYSRGRFGAWQYEVSNQDHTFMQGVEWVDKIINNKEEETFKL